MDKYLKKAKIGFESLNLEQKYKNTALTLLNTWLTDNQFKEYLPQILHLINSNDWDYLLDCFYQIIPFGTGGRRGEIGIGPNRINKWTIQASAQGHAQYLIRKFNNEALSRGVVLAYGVREFFSNNHFNDTVPNPVKNLKGKDLAEAAAEVYVANDIKVMLFDSPRTTPELSFAVRYLNAVAGDMFDASHNPPEHNGKKVYDEYGGQLIPPHDEHLVKEVTENVKNILKFPFDDAIKDGKITILSTEVDKPYLNEVKKLSLSESRNIKIAFTPLHGVGMTSVYNALKELGFDVTADPNTSNQSGRFENVTFNIPNPEVEQSFDTTIKYANQIGADIILNSDPDADRIGIMVKHVGEWVFLNGNEIGVIILSYVADKKNSIMNSNYVVIKTAVTTTLAENICKKNNITIIGDLLVGFKYIGEEMNKLEESGNINNFLFGLEESHGYIAGNYIRDKDASIAGIWLSELSSELKSHNKTIVDYLNEIYSKYGYFRNYLTEIRLPGAEGMSQIQKIQDGMRESDIRSFGKFQVKEKVDYLERKPILSETDRSSKNVLEFKIEKFDFLDSIRVTLRPSGTEPKIKMYFEIGTNPSELSKLESIKNNTEIILKDFEKEFMLHCYKILGVDFPERGFLLFWQIPLKDKLKYFEIEKDILKIKDIINPEERRNKLLALLYYLGADPIEKINKAFYAEYKTSVCDYLNIKC